MPTFLLSTDPEEGPCLNHRLRVFRSQNRESLVK